MPLMGIEKYYAAQQLTDTSAGMTFTTPQYFSLVQEFSVKPKVNSASAYAENRKVDQATEFDSADVALSLYQLINSQRAFVLGQDLDQYGGAIGSQGDNAPWITSLYKAPIKVDGKIYTRYGVIYKTQFQPDDQDYKTTEGKPDFSQVPKLSGSAQPTNWSYKNSKGEEKHPWEYHLDTCDPNFPTDIGDDVDAWWFGSVHVPSIVAIGALALSSSTPANNATNATVDVKPGLTFNNVIVDFNSILLYNSTDATLVSKSLSIDTTSKIVTITPSANLIAGKTYAIIVQGVKDLYGNVLDTQVIKFTVATS